MSALSGEGKVRDAQAGAIYCNKESKAAAVYPDPITIGASSKGNNSKIEWEPFGGSGIKQFTVKLAAGTCQEPTIDQDHKVCTLLPGAPPSQTYQVTADACSAPGTATLAVQ